MSPLRLRLKRDSAVSPFEAAEGGVALFLFEFMDHPRTPRLLRETLLDVLDYCNSDFRPYYKEIAEQVVALADRRELNTIVELGAGYAPLTKELARLSGDSPDRDSPGRQFIPCDLYPEPEAWRCLQREFGNSIQPEFAPVDFTKKHDWGPRAGVVLCATLHHIPPALRRDTLLALHDSADCVLIFEPLRKTPFSMFLVLFAIIPALLTPLFRIRRPGRLRRIVLCWLLPIVPLMFVWDALVSCLRQWSPAEWEKFTATVPAEARRPEITSRPHSQTVVW
jgi:hypothetical protein